MVLAVVALTVPATAADDVVNQEQFKFVDHSKGVNGREFGVAVVRGEDREFASLVASNGTGGSVAAAFGSPVEWHRFLNIWAKAQAVRAATPRMPQSWDYTDSLGTKVTVAVTADGAIEFTLAKGTAVASFALEQSQIPVFAFALARINSHFNEDR